MIEPRLNYVPCEGVGNHGAVRRMAYWEWNATGDDHHPHVVVCVHGLSRQGRDFDTLARALCTRARVVCPDVAGRGQSDWLSDPMAYQVPRYVADMHALLLQLKSEGPVATLDWIGTSMGGLIGLALFGDAEQRSPLPVRRLLLNDVGPTIEWRALQRIGQYLGLPVRFGSLQQAAEMLGSISAGFGPHTPEQWLELTRNMVRPLPDGGFGLHYDPAIAVPFRAVTPELAAQSEALLWQIYDRVTAQVLLVRGAQSDLLSAATAQAMARRGPRARVVELQGVGHAPTFVAEDQVNMVRAFVFDEPLGSAG